MALKSKQIHTVESLTEAFKTDVEDILKCVNARDALVNVVGFLRSVISCGKQLSKVDDETIDKLLREAR